MLVCSKFTMTTISFALKASPFAAKSRLASSGCDFVAQSPSCECLFHGRTRLCLMACLLVSFNVFLLFSLQHHLSHILSLHPLVDTLCVTNSPMLCNEHKRVAPVHAACVCLASNSTCQLRISNPAYINILLGRPGFGRELFM